MKDKLLDTINQRTLFADIARSLEGGARRVGVTGLSLGDEAFFYQGLQARLGKPLFVLKEQQEAERLWLILRDWLGDRVQLLPKRNLLPYRTILKSRELKNARLSVLKKLLEGKVDILLLSEEAFLEKHLPKEAFLKHAFTLQTGDELDRNELTDRLARLGFEKVPVLEHKGQFCVRGDIVDVYPDSEEHPFRLDFFGDFLEKIKVFDLEEQRTLREAREAPFYPCTDLPAPENLEEIARALRPDAPEGLREELDLMEEGIYQEEHERFFPAFSDRLTDVREYSPEAPLLVFSCFTDLKIRSEIYYNGLMEDYLQGEQDGLIHPVQKQGCFKPDLEVLAGEAPILYTSAFDSFELHYDSSFLYEKKLIPSYQGNLDSFQSEVRGFLASGAELFLFSSTREKSGNLKAFFEESSLPLQGVEFRVGSLEESFLLPDLNLAVLGEKDIFGLSRKASEQKRKKKLNPFIDIKAGDYVVHEEYGIAYYKGIEQKEILGVVKDYLILEFQGTGRLFVPVEKMDVIEKYIGAEGHKPKLSNLSSNEWRKTKEKVRISVSDIAKDLLKLYSERKMAKGFPYSPDGSWHRDFADRFPYIETPDQEKAIGDVRKDMEKAMPMDRVIIGDVGYGKTEVALRAAFKAVMDGKQAAILSPTTVLSQQHFRTFQERFAGLPFKIGLLNRFVHQGVQKKVLEELREGRTDILIGTHRILSKDVEFKDLGLLVIDEEQKFGVVHKEKIKNLKSNIDCLVLSATPIPRTLHMALAGARDLSVIETPPKERYPVQTYVVEYDENIIRNSILKELKRQGQVFYVYNRVQTMEARKKQLEKLLPEAVIATAHGQMDEKTLESRMMGFLDGSIDVLLCTTLIENGLNIKNANTLLVEDADNLGLAQIYQLKGRVGRSNRIAYAYFMFDRNKLLSSTAQKRLKAIRELTELGSGFKIAMLDLEIRGAGNLLGKEQHGHMLSVGFDLYCKILEDEVARLSREEEDGAGEEEAGIELDLAIEGHIPSGYIGEDVGKVEIYKRIADLDRREDLLDLIDEVTERFGPIPQAMENLFLLANIRILCVNTHIAGIRRENPHFILTLRSGRYSLELLQKIRLKFKGKVSFRDDAIVLKEENKLYLLEHFLREVAGLLG